MNHDNKPQKNDTLKSFSNKSTLQNDSVENRIQIYQNQLRSLASELSLAEARERREIASDLHDHIGQALAFVKQKVSILQGNAIFSGMEDDFSQILSILDQTIRYTRNLTVEISPPVLYELGLFEAIEWLSERAHKRYKLKIKTSQKGKKINITDDIKIFIFKSIQELISNIAKHAEADKVKINLVWGTNEFQIEVSDNGIGFDTSTFNSGISKNNCFGLFSIRERLSYIGGTFIIESSKNIGTKVFIKAPNKISQKESND